MFEPCSIKALKNLKVEKQIDENQSNSNQQNAQFTEQSLHKISELSSDHPYQIIQHNKEMLNEVNGQIDGIRKWKEEQQKEKEQQIKQNNISLEKGNQQFQQQLLKKDSEFQLYLKELENQQSKYQQTYDKSANNIQNEAENLQLINQKCDQTTLDIQKSYQKVDEIKDLDNLLEKAMMQINAEWNPNKEKLFKEMKMEDNDSKHEQQIDQFNSGVKQWDSELDQILGQMSKKLENIINVQIIKQSFELIESQKKSSKPSKFEQENNQNNVNAQDLQKELEDLEKEFEMVDKILNSKK